MRVLFTVALMVAILGVAVPAVEYVSVDRSATEARDAIDRLIDEARTLAAENDALANETEAARQVVSLDLPDGGFASARVDSVSIGPPESGEASTDGTGVTSRDGGQSAATRIAWRVEGGTRHVTQVPGLRLRPADGGHFELSGGGTQRLALRFVSRDGRRVVTVARQSFK